VLTVGAQRQQAQTTARITVTDCNVQPGITPIAPKLQAFSVYEWTHAVTATPASIQVQWGGVGAIPAKAMFTRSPASTRYTASFTLQVANPSKGPIALANLRLSCPWNGGANIPLPCGTPPAGVDNVPQIGVIPVVPGANGVPVIPQEGDRLLPVGQRNLLPGANGGLVPGTGQIVTIDPITGQQVVRPAAIFQPVQNNRFMVIDRLQVGECIVNNINGAPGLARVPPSTTINFGAPQQSEPVNNKCAKWSVTCTPAVGNPGYVPSVEELPSREVCGDDSNAPIAPSDFTLLFSNGWLTDGTKPTDCTATATVSRGSLSCVVLSLYFSCLCPLCLLVLTFLTSLDAWGQAWHGVHDV
jgi:hypothetical protein